MLVISDLHWRTDTPAWRKETDYAGQVLRPMLGACLDTDEPVVVCGDVFHRSANFRDTYNLFEFLHDRGQAIYAVPGQHDKVNHSNSIVETGFNLLERAGVLRVLKWDYRSQRIDGHLIGGMGWGDELPEGGDILIAHVTIAHGNDNIPGATSASAFADNANGFKLKFTGDNHRRFSIPEKGLYNAGCFHRMTSDLEDQKPAAWRVSPEGEVTLWEIPSPEPMIDIAYKMRSEKQSQVAGEEFVKALVDARENGGGDVFLATLEKAVSEHTGAIKKLLDEVIKKCKEGA